jgi:PAS domain S-box-containing protein
MSEKIDVGDAPDAGLAEEVVALRIINETGALVASQLDLESIVQAVVDAGVKLTGAEFGAFFYNVTDENGDAFLLYALSGAPKEAFSSFPHPRATPVFAPTFHGEGVIRSDDITRDPRYGRMGPHHGMPPGHLPVRSYLAVPVVSRSGEVIGGLFFGHAKNAAFARRHERVMVGIAAQAAVAIDNARLYGAAQAELRKRIAVEDTLRETERRLNAVLDNATVAIFLMNERQECVYMNAAAENLTGYSLAETAGRALHDVIHHTRPDGRHFPREECPIDRAFPENNKEQGEEVFVHKDGRFYPVAFTASPIHDEAARTVGTIIEVRDITGEKQDQRARELLMREVDHRARNALTVVQSILRLTSAADIASFRETVLGRVEALARAQGSLADRQWHGAPLSEVVEGALAAVASPEHYELVGPSLMLAPEQVQPVSMIVHELATNARKYGALSSPGGRLRVAWRTGEGDVEITWREEGGPPVQEPEKKGFGSRLIRELAAQLGGSFSKAWLVSGIAARLTLPR